MKKNFAVTLIALFVVIAFAASLVFAASSAWKLVVRLKGDVESLRQGQTGWDKIWQSRMLKDGDQTRTGDDSFARIKFSDQSSVLIGPKSLVTIAQFDATDTTRVAKVKFDLGIIRVYVSKFLGSDSTFEVTTPNAVLAARGTEFYVEQTANQSANNNYLCYGGDLAYLMAQAAKTTTKLAVFEGQVTVTSAVERYVITTGQTALVNAAGSIFINPTNFTFPAGGPITPDIDVQDLTHPGQSLSNSPITAPPVAPPIFNPSNPHSAPSGYGG